MARYLTIVSVQSNDPYDRDPVKESAIRYEGDNLAEALRAYNSCADNLLSNDYEFLHYTTEMADEDQFPAATNFWSEENPNRIICVYVRDTTK